MKKSLFVVVIFAMTLLTSCNISEPTASLYLHNQTTKVLTIWTTQPTSNTKKQVQPGEYYYLHVVTGVEIVEGGPEYELPLFSGEAYIQMDSVTYQVNREDPSTFFWTGTYRPATAAEKSLDEPQIFPYIFDLTEDFILSQTVVE